MGEKNGLIVSPKIDLHKSHLLLKNVLLIIPELGGGGAEKSFLKISELLAERHTVYLCVFHTLTTVPYPVRIELIDLQTPPVRDVVKKLLYVIDRYQKLREIKTRLRITVSISFLEGADYLNVLSRKREKVVLSVRGSKSSDGQISGWLGTLRRKILIPQFYRRADTVVAVSQGLKLEMQSDYQIEPSKVVTIPNFYDTAQICQYAKQALSVGDTRLFDKPVLIHSGRFHPQKEHLKLLDIFQQVRQRIDCRLLLLGDGELKSEIKEHAQALKLNVGEETEPADVCFLGFQANPFQFIARADLFVLTSSWEGFPNALAEAMICSTSVVSTDCPTGPRELLAPGTDISYQTTEPEETPYGWLMPLLKDQRAIEQWVNAVVGLLTKPDITKVTAARQWMDTFSQGRIAQQWFGLISDSS